MEESFGRAAKDSDLSLLRSSKSYIEINQFESNQVTWSSRYKCFQAYLCFIMSFLSVLKFCERVGKYRVTIFLPYLVCNVLTGVPSVLVEIMIGRFVMGNVSEAWNMCPPARGVFWCLFAITIYVINLSYVYNIYLLKYFFSSFYGYLKWEKCDKSWSKINCFTVGRKSEAMSKCQKNHSEEFCTNLKWETSGMQFWRYSIQDSSNIGEVFISLAFLAFPIILIAAIIYKGIRSLEKLLGLLVYPSIVLWSTVVIVTFTTPQALQGFKKLFIFSWSDFITLKVWVEGFEDTFYLLGLGRLSLSFISSHGHFTDNILYDVVIVIIGSVVSNLLVTVPILSIIASTKVSEEAVVGKPLFADDVEVFVSMSDALVFYPYPRTLWSALHYLNCFLISLSSQAVLVLALCEAIHGVLKKKEKYYSYIITMVSFASFILSACSRYVQVTLTLTHSTLIVTVVILCTITWQLFYGIRKFNYDYFFLLGYRIPMFLKCTWISLLILPFVGLIIKMYYGMPDRPIKGMVFIYFGFVVSIYLLLIVIYILKFIYQKKPVREVFMANPDWGPNNALLKKSRSVFDTSTVTREFMYRQELYKKPFIKPPNFAEQNIVHLI